MLMARRVAQISLLESSHLREVSISELVHLGVLAVVTADKLLVSRARLCLRSLNRKARMTTQSSLMTPTSPPSEVGATATSMKSKMTPKVQ